jgi:hypothetical protein
LTNFTKINFNPIVDARRQRSRHGRVENIERQLTTDIGGGNEWKRRDGQFGPSFKWGLECTESDR